MDVPPPSMDPTVYDAPLRRQFDAFLDDHRQILLDCLDGLTEEQARRRLVPSRTTLLSLVKHATFVEKVWFDEAVTGRPRTEIGIPESQSDSFDLDESDTVASVQEAYRAACDDSRRATRDAGPRRRAARQPPRPPAPAVGHAAHAARARPALRARRDPARAGARGRNAANAARVRLSPAAWPEAARRVADWADDDRQRPSVRVTSVTVMTPEPLVLADFYARLLRVEVSATEPPAPGAPAAAGFAQIRMPHLTLNFEYEEQWSRPVWPAEAGHQSATQHLDLWVADLEASSAWATECGAALADAQPQDDVRVFLDPSGHPFCLFV